MSRPTSSDSHQSFKSASSHYSAGSKRSMTASSEGSFHSAFSTDSYLNSKEIWPRVDDAFVEMIKEVRVLDISMMQERKAQSHAVKKRDPKDLEMRIWSDATLAEYEKYKAEVEKLEQARKVQVKSTKLARTGCAGMPTDVQEQIRRQALEDDKAWLAAALAASIARLAFMQKYPDAFNTPITKTHIKAATDNLNSAKKAMREMAIQETKIADIQRIAAFRAA